MSHDLDIRILQNGSDPSWYWEVVTFQKSVVARGVADLRVLACEQAAAAARTWNRQHWNGMGSPTPKL
jgi:hypothetical protein